VWNYIEGQLVTNGALNSQLHIVNLDDYEKFICYLQMLSELWTLYQK
jgi:hypothetical protein